MKYSTSKDKSI